MLNKLWLWFFIISFIAACYQWLIGGDPLVFERIVSALFSMSKTAVNIAIGLVGALSFWLGILKIAEQAGLVDKLAWVLVPLFKRLMPQVPSDHPAIGSITMNLSANILGLDNAATPMGIRAMKDLQTLNPTPDTASDAQILFLVLNTSSVTLFPIAVFVYRAQQGAAMPTDVFLPILLATGASTFAGLLAVSWVQRLRLYDWVTFAYFSVFLGLVGGLITYLSVLTTTQLTEQSALISHLLIFSFIVLCLVIADRKKVNVYETFIDGAKEGFSLSVSLIPYLLAMLVAIAVLRASGVLTLAVDGLTVVIGAMGIDTAFVDALPTALMKPFSGSGARAMMIETMTTHGADSFVGRVASTIQGSTETTFYVIAVYFGAVGIKHSRHAIGCGLFADVVGIISAISVCYWFFA
ncbi:MAG: spore maturation protein SpmA [Alteromonadaceae bacterium]